MKILHVTPTYYPATYWGGPIFSVYHMNNALAELPGVQLKVLTTDSAGPKLVDRLDVASVDRSQYPNQMVIFTRRVAGVCVSIELLRRLPALIRWADGVHLTATFSFPTLPTLALCRLYGKPVVWSFRGALLDDQNRHAYAPQSAFKHLIKATWNRLCRWCISPDRVALHVTTEQERVAVSRIYPESRFSIIPNGVEVPATMPQRDRTKSDGWLRLMFMGRFAPKKGIENLLQAVAKLDIPVSLDLYGTSTVGQGGRHYGEGLISLARELGLMESTVRFRGQVTGDAKTRAFTASDVCIIPSYSENFCIVVAEALAMGMPVIVSSKLLQWEEVVQQNCGLWVDNDPESLAQAIDRIRDMDLSAMGKNGKEWVMREFDWKRIARDMRNVYDNLIEEAKYVH